jgi:hypothetical protein
MATVQVGTLACVRNIPNISISYLWHSALVLGLMLSFVFPARADTITNRIYPGTFDAGDQWVIWNKLRIGNVTEVVNNYIVVQPQSSSGNVTIARIGLQQAGIFP